MKIEQFTEKARQAVSEANELAKQYNNNQIEVEHLLAALLSQEGGVVQQIIQRAGGDLVMTQRQVNDDIERLPCTNEGSEPSISPRLRKLLEAAWKEMINFHDKYLGVEHMLLAVFKIDEESAQSILKTAGLTRDLILKALASIRSAQQITDQNPERKYLTLEKYSRNLTQLAEQGKLDPVIGRDEEIRKVIEILNRRTRNNPVLIGESGVGKATIVEGLAQRIVRGDVPKTLRNKQIIRLDLGALHAGAKYPDEFEERLKAVLKEITRSEGIIILFIDELSNLVGTGTVEGTMDTSNIWKSMLERGELHCIGETTLDEYRKHIEKDAALERRFQTVMIDQLTVENTINILRCLKQRYEVHHGVRIQDSALVAATILSNHYITDRFLPIKAIDLVDEAASRRRIELDSVPVEIDAVYGRIRMLMIEREAFRRETDPASRERQAKVEQEIANLNEQLHSLQLALEREREPIEKIRLLKKELEQAQVNYDKAEYERDFGKMAELHYGIIPDLERRIQDMESKLISIQGTRMLKEEVDSEDIAEIISKLTHIPISMLMREDEEQKKPEIGENTLTVSKGSIEIFFCYAHEDELLLKKLETQLAALKRQGWIKLWYDRYISPGTEWKTEIDEHLNRAQIILLLISPDFMNSDYCYGIEMKRALERHNCGEAWVIPIILRPVYWKVEPLSTLQALPTDAIPVTAGSWHSLDDAFFNVDQGIRKVIKEMTKNSDV